jgi:hypothetical protein
MMSVKYLCRGIWVVSGLLGLTSVRGVSRDVVWLHFSLTLLYRGSSVS